jgi:hypothetical protein
LKINENYILEIKIRFNRVAEMIIIGFGLALAYFLVTEVIIQVNNEFIFLLRRTLVSLILFSIFQALPLYIYYDLKNQTLKELISYFELTKVKTVKKKS